MRKRAAQMISTVFLALIMVAPSQASAAPVQADLVTPEPVLKGGLSTHANHPPVAVDDWFSTLWETPIFISFASILANDSDPDGDPLQVCGLGQPRHGQLSYGLAGVTYTPPDGCLVGLDSFTYKLCDGQGGEDRATIHVSIGGIICPDDNDS